jgi:ribosomal protein L1
VAPVVRILIPQAKELMAMILQSIPHLRRKAAAVVVVTDGQHFPTAKESKAAVVADLERRMP